MEKSNKELAVELLGQYMRAIYSGGATTPLTQKDLEQILMVFYNAIKKIPAD